MSAALRLLVGGYLVAVVGAALVGCSQEPQGPLPAGIRLLEQLGSATVRCPERAALEEGAALEGRLVASAGSDLVLDEKFEAPLDARWFDEAWRKGLPQSASSEPRTQVSPRLGEEGSCVVELDSAGCTLHRFLPATAEDTYLVRARVQSLNPEAGAGAGIWAVPHPDPAPDAVGLAAHVVALDKGETRAGRRALLTVEDGGEWRELAVVCRPYPGRRSLSLTLLSGEGGARVDRVEVRRLTPAEEIGSRPRESMEGFTDPLRRKIRHHHQTWDTLVLPAPGAVEFTVAIPAVRPRLELATAAAARRDGGSVVLRILVDGEEIARRERRVEPGAMMADFEPWTVPLDGLEDTVVLSLEAAGREGDVALFGAPTILGTPVEPPPNLLLISLDTLRADHLGCYGAEGELSPTIDRLAADGVRFARVIAPSSYTLPTHASVMTGQHPLVHDTFHSTRPMDPVRSPTLAARLRQEGFRTAAFTGGGLVHPRYGFGVGFDSYTTADPGGVPTLHRRIGDEPATEATDEEDRVGDVVGWLERHADQPWFLFVHTYLVHNYRPEPRFRALFDDGSTAEVSDDEVRALQQGAREGDAEAAAQLRRLYRATVRQADELIVGRLLETLDRLDLAEHTLVCLLSDHGEEFLEHDEFGHGHALWGELTSVPWILRGPGLPEWLVQSEPVAFVHSEPARLADVAPTVLRLLGLEPDRHLLGRDRLAASLEEDPDEPFVLSLRGLEGAQRQDGLVLGGWKLLRLTTADGEVALRLYRLDRDPAESEDLAGDDEDRARALAEQLDRFQRELRARAAALPSSGRALPFEMPPELEERLKGLGYLRR